MAVVESQLFVYSAVENERIGDKKKSYSMVGWGYSPVRSWSRHKTNKVKSMIVSRQIELSQVFNSQFKYPT